MPPADPTRRSERARRAIHAAARELVAEQGFARVTVEAIAARAGVGKQTIYRWWPSKSAVVLDVLVAENVLDNETLALPDSGDLRADLRGVLVETIAYFTDAVNDNLLRAMTAELQYDLELAARVLDDLLRPQFDAFVDRIAAAKLIGPNGSPVDPEVVAEQLLAPIFHRWLLRRAPLTEGYVDVLLDHLVPPASAPAVSPQRHPPSRSGA